nr:AAA family ATPase [Candidatus Delongbacteria bacterium]
KTIKKFENRKKQIIDLSQLVENTINFNLKIWKTYSNYIENYFASSKDHNLTEFYVKNLRDNLITIEKKIDDKIINIHNSIGLGIDFFQRITDDIKSYNKVIENNNNKILLLNNKLNNLTKENQNIRRNLCKALFNELTIEYKPIIQSIKTLDLEIGKIAKDIKKKQELNKINRKEKVAETVSSILKFFFKDKYTLDKETFRLIFKSMKLEEGQASNILSEGEKSIIAFAYYMGDTHLKVNTVDDYDKIFFIIDDPISSMDFNHVYALSSIIRDLKVVLNFEKKVRLIIFTHNLEFMRIIVANNIVSNNFLLHEGEIKKFNNTLSVPYISHLVDIFKISDSKRDPDHTTPNSIRHILETITKFESLELGKDSIKIYLEKYFKDDIKIYPLINDLSHGAWRNEQDTITDTEYVLLCKAVIDHINVKYQNQIDYCRKLCNS